MIEIPLTRGAVALVDDEDADMILQYNWILLHGVGHSTKYAVRSGCAGFMMHRFLMSPPPGMVVDHIDHNGLNNQRANLRVVTYSQNTHHRRNPAKGYTWEGARRKWKAAIVVDGKSIYLGRFDTEQEAASAYERIRSEIFGD